MINKAKLALIAAVAAVSVVSPALAQNGQRVTIRDEGERTRSCTVVSF